MRVRYTPAAREHFTEITDAIAKDNRQAASHVIEAIRSTPGVIAFTAR
jgi:plasmid stabilization system protein ParE